MDENKSAVLCVFDVAAGAYGAKVDLISFLDPIRAEARPMGGVERVPIIGKTVEQEAFIPGLDTHNVGLRKNSVLFVTMVPIRTNNKLRKISIYSVVQSPIRDWIGKYHKVCPQMRQKCWAVADVFNRPSETKSARACVSRWPPFRLIRSNHDPRSVLGSEDPPLPPRDNRVYACRKGGDERYVNCRPRGGWWPHPLLLGIALLPTCIFFAITAICQSLLGRDRYGRFLRWGGFIVLGCFAIICWFFSGTIGTMDYWWIR